MRYHHSSKRHKLSHYIFSQAEMAPETTLRTGSQKGRGSVFKASCKSLSGSSFLKEKKTRQTSNLCDPSGASEISDACKPLKKRSRASTDVEMTSSQYRDTSDSDSRGLNDSQVSFRNVERQRQLSVIIIYLFLTNISLFFSF